MPPRFTSLALSIATLGLPLVAWGDVFELKDGGAIVGQPIDQQLDNQYIVRTADGALVTLDRNQLQRVVKQETVLEEYTRRSRTAPDTPEAHRQLVAWCREHRLTAQTDHHLARLAELDPNDAEARRSLGLQQMGGKWMSREELMGQRGMVFYEGKFRTRQDVAIRERNKQGETVDVDWFSNLRTWRGWLESRREDRVAEAQTHITTINDPSAAPALIRLLNDEEDPWIFKLLLTTLGGLDHPAAVQTLVAYSLEEEDPEIRAQCLDFLINAPRPVSILPYVQALKSRDNVIVNRAGEALGKIGDKAAISPLIDALVTNHKRLVQAGSTGGTPMAAGFNPSGGGGGGLSMGGNGPVVVKEDKENSKVHGALVKLTGIQEFDFDMRAWRRWYVDQQMRQRFNARRDQ